MKSGALGKFFNDKDVIFSQGDSGTSLYIIQEGQVEVVREINGVEVRLAVRGKGEFIGEMAAFEGKARSATVRALGDAHILTIDKKNFFRRVHEDSSLTFHLLQIMSSRIRELSAELTEIRGMRDYGVFSIKSKGIADERDHNRNDT